MRRIAAILAALMAMAPAANAVAATAELETHALSLSEAGAVATVLRPSQPVTRFDVAVPHRWTEGAIEMDLRWTGSEMLADGSAVSIEVGDVPLSAVPVVAGPGAAAVSSSLAPVADHRITVTIRATLRARDGVSPRAAARGLFVRLDPLSVVRVSGAGVSTLLLSDLPGVLVERVGDRIAPLTIALPASPPAAAIHAAAIVAGAVSSRTGFPGARIATLINPTEAVLAARAGALVRIEDRPGVARASVLRRAGGQAELRIGGRGAALIDGAQAVAYGAAMLPGNAAIVEGGGPLPAIPPFDDLVRLGPASAEDTEPVVLRLPFRIPVGRVVDSADAIIEIAYDTPSGARLSLRANGRPIESRTLPVSGEGRTSIAASLSRAVRPGDNSLEIVATPAEAAGSAASLPARIDVVRGSRLTLRTHARVAPALDWWPFLTAGDADWEGTVVSIPVRPTVAEVDAIVDTLAEAVRWTGRPLRYTVAFDASIQETLRNRNVIALVRSPDAVARLVPGGATDGSLAITRRGAHTAVIAVGPRALTPLSSAYFAGSVRGSVVVVDARGDTHRILAAPREPAAGRRWWWPVAVATAVVVLLLAAGFVRAKRRFTPRENDVPWAPSVPETVVPRPRVAPSPPSPAPLDADRALDEWLRIRDEHSL